MIVSFSYFRVSNEQKASTGESKTLEKGIPPKDETVNILPLHTIFQRLRYGKETNAQITPPITTRNIAWGQEDVKATFQEQVEIPFGSVRQLKSSCSRTKLGLNARILMQSWARITRDKLDPVICLKAKF